MDGDKTSVIPDYDDWDEDMRRGWVIGHYAHPSGYADALDELSPQDAAQAASVVAALFAREARARSTCAGCGGEFGDGLNASEVWRGRLWHRRCSTDAARTEERHVRGGSLSGSLGS